MTNKEILVGKLLENKSINFEEALLLLEKEVVYQSISVPYIINTPYDSYPNPYPTYVYNGLNNKVSN